MHLLLIEAFTAYVRYSLLLPGLTSTRVNPLQQIKLSLGLCFIRKEIIWF